MIECAPFIVMVWSHDKSGNNVRFFEGGWAPQKIIQNLKKGAELP